MTTVPVTVGMTFYSHVMGKATVTFIYDDPYFGEMAEVNWSYMRWTQKHIVKVIQQNIRLGKYYIW
jgi:hypothetical protein